MDFETAFPLLVATFCIVAPSALFVGLVRGLERLRDDQFVDQVLANLDDPPDDASVAPNEFLRTATASADPETRQCGSCGLENPAYADYCAACLTALGDGTRGRLERVKTAREE
jgi:hypothetical protein